jgi:replicative DNA helicase
VGRKELAYQAATQGLDWSLYRQSLASVTVVDRQGLSVADMSTVLRRLQDGPMRDTPIRVVTIDHLGLVAGHDRHEEYTRVSRIARELKDFAKRHGVVVMVAIQVNRDAGGDGSKRLHLGSARDSGVVEEAVDYLLAFRRFDRTETQPEHVRTCYRNVLFLSAPKVRHEDPSQDEVAVRYDHTLVIEPAPDMSIPETADTAPSRVAHFGGRR